jgi:hypothetical protein
MIIKGFWHLYLTNHWYSIVADQMRIMLTSGLYDACYEINIGCIQPAGSTEAILLKKLFVEQYPKLKIRYISDKPTDYEFRTLKLIEQDKEKYAGFYFHTKAVTNPSDTIQNHWRAWLNESILNRWGKHYWNVCEKDYDVSSVNHCLPPAHPEHFSGNFWWFDRGYINELPKIDSLNKNNRWLAEQWVCRSKTKRVFAEEFIEPGRDVFLMNFRSEENN